MANATSVVRLPVLSPAVERPRLALLDQYRREQQELTAVDRFARQHGHAAAGAGAAAADGERPAQERYYRDLLPGAKPREGQQYAFEVDLDACTGCKACVAACHS